MWYNLIKLLKKSNHNTDIILFYCFKAFHHYSASFLCDFF